MEEMQSDIRSRSSNRSTTKRRQIGTGSQCGSVSSSSSTIRIKAEMERASLLAKAAALRDKLALEKEEAVWRAEKRCREAEEKCREAEFEAAMKARKEMHEMQTALAESDAKIEVLQKYENTQVEMSSAQIEQKGETNVKTSFQPPLQLVSSPPKVKHNILPAPLENAPPSPNMDSNNERVFDGFCKAMSQKANVTCEESQSSFTP